MKKQRQRTYIEIILWKNRSHLISHYEVQKSEETSLRMTVLFLKIKDFPEKIVDDEKTQKLKLFAVSIGSNLKPQWSFGETGCTSAE